MTKPEDEKSGVGLRFVQKRTALPAKVRIHTDKNMVTCLRRYDNGSNEDHALRILRCALFHEILRRHKWRFKMTNYSIPLEEFA